MFLFALGINHETAPVAVRERVAFGRERLPQALRDLKAQTGLNEAAIISTCNRTEIYGSAETDLSEETSLWLHRTSASDPSRLTPFLYRHTQQAAVRHLMRVACGLESMVLGEPQILGQVKEAYLLAREANTLAAPLNRLFEHSFHVAKRVRSDTLIGHSSVSVAAAAVKLARQIFGDLKRETVLLIGAGETIELTARHLSDHGVRKLIVANRSLERAELLASRFSGYAIALGSLDQHLAHADIIISSTAAPEPIVSRSALKAALKERKHKPIFIVDLAVPRDVEPAAAELEDVYLYTVDDLASVVETGANARREAAIAAGEIVDLSCLHYTEWLHSLDANRVIRALRGRAEGMRDELVAKSIAQIRAGKDPEDCMRQLAHALTNRILHEPSLRLRESAALGNDQTIAAAEKLFGLEPPNVE